jgi:hypothetical protein
MELNSVLISVLSQCCCMHDKPLQAARLHTAQKVNPMQGRLPSQRLLTGTTGTVVAKMDTETDEQKEKRKVST